MSRGEDHNVGHSFEARCVSDLERLIISQGVSGLLTYVNDSLPLLGKKGG